MLDDLPGAEPGAWPRQVTQLLGGLYHVFEWAINIILSLTETGLNIPLFHHTMVKFQFLQTHNHSLFIAALPVKQSAHKANLVLLWYVS